MERKLNTSINEINIGGTTTSDPLLIANSINNYFCSIPSELQNSLSPPVDLNQFDSFSSIRNSLSLAPSSPSEVSSTINEFENKKCNIDDISFKIFKLVSPYIASLFNVMIEERSYPDCLKLAKVTPVFKSGNAQLCCNYRPISVLKNLNKIIEKLILKRLTHFLSINNVMYKHQYGFTAHKGTTDACIRVISTIQNFIRENKYVVSVFYDFKKAFDTVDHHRLLFKLQKYGIRGNALNVFESYLNNRFQCVNIKGTNSSLHAVKYGVPQGSILGPVLFNLYINDLNYYLNDITLTHYADDTTTLCADSNLVVAFQKTQGCLNLFQSWTTANLLTLNVTKTSYLLFTPRLNECIVPPNLTINDISLAKVHFIRYLGLLIDDKLKFDIHISSVSSRLSRAAGVSFAIGNNLSYDAARSLYFSFTHSIISYLLLFWGSSFNIHLKRVQVVQNRVIRNLFARKIVHANTTDLFHKVNILKVKDLYYKELGISFYKALHLHHYDSIMNSLNALNWTHNYNTRKINYFRLPKSRYSAHSRHLLFVGVQFWNSLPLNLRAAQSLSTFKKLLHKHLLDKYAVR